MQRIWQKNRFYAHCIERMERGEMNLDAMGKEIKNAQQLIRLCKDKLTKTEEEINAIIS